MFIFNKIEGKSGHQNHHSLHLYLTEIICFCQLKSEGIVEVSEDTSTSNLEPDRQDIYEISEITLTIISVQL